MLKKFSIDFITTKLNEYDLIIIVEQDVTDAILSSMNNRIAALSDMKILVITINECAEDFDRDFIVGLGMEDFFELTNLYSKYEFSNRISLLSREANYGSLFNYLDTGLITEDEMITAILE